VEVSWPHVVIALRRNSNRRQAAIRFLLDRYPDKSPVLELWDPRRRERIEPYHWPNWFLKFVLRYYPGVALIEPAFYLPELLRVSLLVANELKRGQRAQWDRSGDLTQCLGPLSDCFRDTSPGYDRGILKLRQDSQIQLVKG
jgi:hypothetical protein